MSVEVPPPDAIDEDLKKKIALYYHPLVLLHPLGHSKLLIVPRMPLPVAHAHANGQLRFGN